MACALRPNRRATSGAMPCGVPQRDEGGQRDQRGDEQRHRQGREHHRLVDQVQLRGAALQPARRRGLHAGPDAAPGARPAPCAGTASARAGTLRAATSAAEQLGLGRGELLVGDGALRCAGPPAAAAATPGRSLRVRLARRFSCARSAPAAWPLLPVGGSCCSAGSPAAPAYAGRLLRRVLLRPAALLAALDVAGDVRRGAGDDGGACGHPEQSHGAQFPVRRSGSRAALTASAGIRAWSTTCAPARSMAVDEAAGPGVLPDDEGGRAVRLEVGAHLRDVLGVEQAPAELAVQVGERRLRGPARGRPARPSRPRRRRPCRRRAGPAPGPSRR